MKGATTLIFHCIRYYVPNNVSYLFFPLSELLPNGTHRLEIKRCQARHCTQFAVRAENKLGVAERMWNVEVVLVDDDDSMRSIKSQDLNVHENVTPHQSQSTLNDVSLPGFLAP